MKKILSLILLSSAVVFLCSACSGEGETPDFTEESHSVKEIDLTSEKLLEVRVFDTGKSDAILITVKEQSILIDAGDNNDGEDIASYLSSVGIEKLDYFIITHFDKDHVGGADKIIEAGFAGRVIVPDYGKDSKQYNQFIDAAKNADVEIETLTEAVTFRLEEAEVTLLPPDREYIDFASDGDGGEISENDFSIAAVLTHGENKFIFAGDAMAERISELLKTEGIKGEVFDFLKVPHHGKYNIMSGEFINSLSPRYAVITCSEDEPADERTITALERVGAEVYMTVNGEVFCKSDGENLVVGYE